METDTDVVHDCAVANAQLLLSKDILCLAVKMPPNRAPKPLLFHGLFDVRLAHPECPSRTQIVQLTRACIVPHAPCSRRRQFADVNAFLTLAATRHKIRADELRGKPRVQEILDAARDGKVPAHLVCSTSRPTLLSPSA